LIRCATHASKAADYTLARIIHEVKMRACRPGACARRDKEFDLSGSERATDSVLGRLALRPA